MRYLSDRITLCKDKLIVRCAGANLPGLGDKLFDQNRKPLGRVFDIIGPITKPWIVAILHKNAVVTDNTLVHVESTRKAKRTQKKPKKKHRSKPRR